MTLEQWVRERLESLTLWARRVLYGHYAPIIGNVGDVEFNREIASALTHLILDGEVSAWTAIRCPAREE